MREITEYISVSIHTSVCVCVRVCARDTISLVLIENVYRIVLEVIIVQT